MNKQIQIGLLFKPEYVRKLIWSGSQLRELICQLERVNLENKIWDVVYVLLFKVECMLLFLLVFSAHLKD